MGGFVQALLAVCGGPICDSPAAHDVGLGFGQLGRDLAEMLAIKNGFYAFDSALLVRPGSHSSAPLGIKQWNEAACWKASFGHVPGAARLCFAEDIFGVQFCLHKGSVRTFDPETGEFAAPCPTLDEWARLILEYPEVRTGSRLARQWQERGKP